MGRWWRSSCRQPPRQASANSPCWIAVAVGDAGALTAPGLDRSAVQPLWTLVAGCSGNVVPGVPESASAGPAISAVMAMLAATLARTVVVRLMASPFWVTYWWSVRVHVTRFAGTARRDTWLTGCGPTVRLARFGRLR